IGAHEPHALVPSAQAIGEFLRQYDERGAVAAPGNMQAATEHRQLHVAGGNEPTADLGRKDRLAAEIKLWGRQSVDRVRCRSSDGYFSGAVISDIDVGDFVDHPEPRRKW